jgi:hypothetical protein
MPALTTLASEEACKLRLTRIVGSRFVNLYSLRAGVVIRMGECTGVPADSLHALFAGERSKLNDVSR